MNFEDFGRYLNERMPTVDFKKFLTEDEDPFVMPNDSDGSDGDSDDTSDPFADDTSDPFADDTTGQDDSNDSSKDEGDEGEEDEEADEPTATDLMDDREDDPEFKKGLDADDSVMLADIPSGEMIYDTKKVLNSINALIETLSEEDLVEMNKLKTAVELIFNGKKLKLEDVQFDDVENANMLISKLKNMLDDKTANYLVKKIKEPLIVFRDKSKLKMADLNKNVDIAVDAIDSFDDDV